jgi:hypothetical protein
MAARTAAPSCPVPAHPAAVAAAMETEMFAKLTSNPGAVRRQFVVGRTPTNDNRVRAVAVRRERLVCRWRQAENGRLECSWELQKADALAGDSNPPSTGLRISHWSGRGCARDRLSGLAA